jgi:hypothetical protein
MAMIAITTSNSINVKPLLAWSLIFVDIPNALGPINAG